MAEFDAIEERWQRAWQERRAYEPSVDPARPKFFATYPYSYMNAYAHVGHAFTMARVDFAVRHQRMKGKNVLFPFAYHLTGTPIVAAANRVREGEQTQWRMLREQGFSDEEVAKFAQPWRFAEVFPPEWRKDVSRLGLGIDWRRQFFTTDRNPWYDRFIRWQFTKLAEGGYVGKGRHPVIWCPKDRQPIADHDRREGEGETPQEYVLVKLRLTAPAAGLPAGTVLPAATLRPETMFAQTNAWVDPDMDYAVLDVAGETWVASPTCAQKLPHQLDRVTEKGRVAGRALVGARVHAPAREEAVLVLPASFLKPHKGTGIVTSVPSDAPFDFAALSDLQRDERAMAEFGLDAASVRALSPIPVIDSGEAGTLPAPAEVKRLGVQGQRDVELLEKATETVYQAGFYNGRMLERAGEFTGLPVAQAKAKVAQWLLSRGDAERYFEPTGPVVCRCLSEGIVKIVSDQWFLTYGDPAWKEKTHEALDRMTIHPEVARKQFHYVVDWLRDWACARDSGLGTRLPMDESRVVESLSDSTIYMAYYTFAHLLDASVAEPAFAVDPKDLTDAFFGFVLLGRGNPANAARGTVTREVAEACRREFAYWYPFDLRNSGKDLLQNHLTFAVFNHVAIWPDEPERWPRGMGVNGWVMVDGQKMSKSAGNFVTLRQALDQYGASAVRMALANAGEGLDDASFERDFAATIGRRLAAWLDVYANPPPASDRAPTRADRAFASALHRILADLDAEMEKLNFRTALKLAFFDLASAWSWYVRRSAQDPSRALRDVFLSAQARALSPFVPHLAEEAWSRLGNAGSVIEAPWPVADPAARDEEAERAESYLREVLDDVRAILKVTGLSPSRVVLYVAEPWKRSALSLAVLHPGKGGLDVGAFMKAAQQDPELRARMKELPALAQKLGKEMASGGAAALAGRAKPLPELEILREALPFLSAEIPATWEVHAAGEGPDPAGKAKQAMPGRPAIYVQ